MHLGGVFFYCLPYPCILSLAKKPATYWGGGFESSSGDGLNHLVDERPEKDKRDNNSDYLEEDLACFQADDYCGDIDND